MNDTTLQKTFIDKGCFPHQAQFAAAFFAPNAPRKHLLISAPGLGKGFVSAAIVNHALSSGEAHRILVLAPSALLVQWQEMIRRGDPAVPAMIVDRRRFRELDDSQPPGGEIWPAHGVIILSLDFAKQPDVAAPLARCSWDLLVVDEVHLASPETQRAKVLVDLMNRNPHMRGILLRAGDVWTEGEIKTSAELYRDAKVTVWTRDTLRDHQGKPLLPEVRMTWITYRRQPEETEVLSLLQASLRSLDRTNEQLRLVGTILLQSASSSLFALEQRLRRLHQRRNDLVHTGDGNQENEREVEELGMGASATGKVRDVVQAHVELAKISEPLLKLLEELPTDSKCDALLRLLDSIGTVTSPDRRVCVFTRFVDTATYLGSILQEIYHHVRVLTGSIPFADREQVIVDFAQAGGILIATEVVKTTTPEVAAVVLYDLPLNPAVLEARIGQFVRVGRPGPIQIFALTDESNALVIERLQRKIAEGKENISEQEIEQALFSTEDR